MQSLGSNWYLSLIYSLIKHSINEKHFWIEIISFYWSSLIGFDLVETYVRFYVLSVNHVLRIVNFYFSDQNYAASP